MQGPAIVKMGFNLSDKIVHLFKCDERSKEIVIPVGSEQCFNIIIPSCYSQEDFDNQRYIEIDIEGGRKYYLWDDGWKVKCTDEKKFNADAAAVPGDSNVNEIKYLVIKSNDQLKFIKQNAIVAECLKEQYLSREECLRETGLRIKYASYVKNEKTHIHPEWRVRLCAQNVNKSGWPSMDEMLSLAFDFVGIVCHLHLGENLLKSIDVLCDYKSSMDEKSIATSITGICMDAIKIAQYYGDKDVLEKLYASARTKLYIGKIDNSPVIA